MKNGKKFEIRKAKVRNLIKKISVALLLKGYVLHWERGPEFDEYEKAGWAYEDYEAQVKWVYPQINLRFNSDNTNIYPSTEEVAKILLKKFDLQVELPDGYKLAACENEGAVFLGNKKVKVVISYNKIWNAVSIYVTDKPEAKY